MKLIWVICALFAQNALASFDHGSLRTDDFVSRKNRSESSKLIPGVYPQLIDHSVSGGATFDQRYWYDSQYASGINAPVLYHICGEGNAEDGYFLNDNAIEWAKALGAHLVYLEHRYYGKSVPHGSLDSKSLKELTLDNIIEDLATFQKFITAQKGWTGKWITLGGSYSGTLSALYRQAHPELVVGALAASAPMISGVGSDMGTSMASRLMYTDASNDSGDRPWAYQSCTTFGFWLASGSSTFYLPSSALCQKVFGSAPRFDSVTYNQKYYTPFIQNDLKAPSNILFTYGGRDVWTKIGISAQNNANSKIAIEVIPGAGHHEDLNAPSSFDSAAIKHARATFLQLAKQWLQ